MKEEYVLLTRKINDVKKKRLKLEQMKQEIERANRALVSERNALLNEMSTTNSPTTKKKMRSSSVIKETVKQMRHALVEIKSSDTIRSEQLSIATKEAQLSATACNENEVQLSVDGRMLLIGGYTFSIPRKSLKKLMLNSSVPCEGCEQLFPCYRTPSTGKVIFGVAYFRHTFSCRQFMSLDSIKYCHECKLIFRNAIQLGSHHCEKRPRISKPTWMTSAIYSNARGEMSLNVSCLGCKIRFMAISKVCTGSVQPELAYYIHCIEQCSKYKKLNLIAKCRKCDKLFLHKQALGVHISKEHGSTEAGEPVRSWMIPSLRRDIRYNFSYNSSKECDGCGQKFPCWKNRSGNNRRVHRSYYIHCIEECELYRALGKIFTCPVCKCKFPRKTSHKCLNEKN